MTDRRKAFTMVELIVIVALLGLLVIIVSPKLLWTEPPKRVLQRALLEAIDTARRGVSVRFRLANAMLVPEIFVQTENIDEWLLLTMEYPPAGDAWKVEPEIIYFSPDGTCTPAKLRYGEPPDAEKFLLTVTGYLVEEK